MPHIVVKLWPGNSDQQKNRVAELIVKDVMEALGSKEGSISVSIEEIHPDDWKEQVYTPDIINNAEKLFKKPGYTM